MPIQRRPLKQRRVDLTLRLRGVEMFVDSRTIIYKYLKVMTRKQALTSCTS